MKGFVSYILGLCRKKEGTEVEFKSALGGFPGSFWETYSAFANTKGGVIVLGVKEKNHRFTPDGFTEDQVNKYKKTFWDCANNKWPAPEIKEHFGQNDDRVELTLRIGQSTSSPKNGAESGLKSRLKSGQKIVELMRENPSITIAELVSELGMSRSGISKQIAKLKADRVIEREGSDKSGRWIVNYY